MIQINDYLNKSLELIDQAQEKLVCAAGCCTLFRDGNRIEDLYSLYYQLNTIIRKLEDIKVSKNRPMDWNGDLKYTNIKSKETS